GRHPARRVTTPRLLDVRLDQVRPEGLDLYHFTQEEPGHVEVVDGHVPEQAAGRGDVGSRRGRRVPAGGEKMLQAADLPAGQPLSQLGEGRVEPAGAAGAGG